MAFSLSLLVSVFPIVAGSWSASVWQHEVQVERKERPQEFSVGETDSRKRLVRRVVDPLPVPQANVCYTRRISEVPTVHVPADVEPEELKKAHLCSIVDEQCAWRNVEVAKAQCTKWDRCEALFCKMVEHTKDEEVVVEEKFLCFARKAEDWIATDEVETGEGAYGLIKQSGAACTNGGFPVDDKPLPPEQNPGDVGVVQGASANADATANGSGTAVLGAKANAIQGASANADATANGSSTAVLGAKANASGNAIKNANGSDVIGEVLLWNNGPLRWPNGTKRHLPGNHSLNVSQNETRKLLERDDVRMIWRDGKWHSVNVTEERKNASPANASHGNASHANGSKANASDTTAAHNAKGNASHANASNTTAAHFAKGNASHANASNTTAAHYAHVHVHEHINHEEKRRAWRRKREQREEQNSKVITIGNRRIHIPKSVIPELAMAFLVLVVLVFVCGMYCKPDPKASKADAAPEAAAPPPSIPLATAPATAAPVAIAAAPQEAEALGAAAPEAATAAALEQLAPDQDAELGPATAAALPEDSTYPADNKF